MDAAWSGFPNCLHITAESHNPVFLIFARAYMELDYNQGRPHFRVLWNWI
jgi:hypothetical protein